MNLIEVCLLELERNKQQGIEQLLEIRTRLEHFLYQGISKTNARP
jgi:hypothetical protein